MRSFWRRAGALLAIGGCAALFVLLARRPENRVPPSGPTGKSSPPAATATTVPPLSARVSVAPEPTLEPKLANPIAQNENATSTPATNAAAQRTSPPPRPRNPPPQDELARMALSFVGMDPEAEAYWRSAIDDPNLPRDERQNLIEDLNEDGLSNPRHPTPQDLPLILSRLELIEELAPNAMDQVNADAFQEAYKDLVNLGELAQGRGRPVQ